MAFQFLYREKGLLSFTRGRVYASFDSVLRAADDYCRSHPNRDCGVIEVCDSLDSP